MVRIIFFNNVRAQQAVPGVLNRARHDDHFHVELKKVSFADSQRTATGRPGLCARRERILLLPWIGGVDRQEYGRVICCSAALGYERFQLCGVARTVQ